MASISASVGKGGRNKQQDIILVQKILKYVGIDPGPVDGICGKKTIGAITKFQSSFLFRPDGLIEPNKNTWRKLTVKQTKIQSVIKKWSGDSSMWSQQKKLTSLNPIFRQKVQTLIQRLKSQGFQPKVFFGWRSVVVQQELVRKGKSRVKFSFHNAQKPDGTPNAYAVDIIDKRYAWSKEAKEKGYWAAQGEGAKNLGLTWGGDWKNPWDPAHVQLYANAMLGVIKRRSGL